jgi:serine/threonine protein kinase
MDSNTLDPDVADLVCRWESLKRQGQPASPEIVCAERPDLLDAVRQAIGAIERFPVLPDGHEARPRSPATLIDSQPPIRAAGAEEAPFPKNLGKYKIVAELGKGSFGTVFKGYDEDLHLEVAIKVPHRHRLHSDADRELFLKEARILAGLDHANIIPAFAFDRTDDGRCYVVCKFVQGSTSLADSMKERVFSAREAATIVAAIANALHYAHRQGLVHRDIKPKNILIDGSGKPFVIDFGLALKDEDFGEAEDFAGTIPFMSPEQARFESNRLDGRSDIFSLGVVFYELLTGKRPFRGETKGKLLDQIKNMEPKPPRMIDDKIPKELERICLKALRKSVHERYTTAKDMADELLEATKPGTSETIPDFSIPLHEVERRLLSSEGIEEDELLGLLRRLNQTTLPRRVLPRIFRCLTNSSQQVRQEARSLLHSFGWNKVSDAVEDLARQGNSGIVDVLDGLAAFKAHPEVVELLDRLLVCLKGDLRNRAILLLERKRLALDLEEMAALFREIRSPYRLQKALGQGLVTAAYLAHAEGTELAVVVRLLRSELVGQALLRTQFLDANKKALHLVQENLVLTREVRAFPERNIYFAVRDYVDGVTLQKVLEGGKRFESAQILAIFRQLLAALAAVHHKGMVHGGVKPSNIFICADDRVVLGDPSLPVKATGLVLDRLSYDYRYAAPETLHGTGTPGAPSDLYALGCVLYELACGEPPFVSDNYLELAYHHMHEEPERIGDFVILKTLGTGGMGTVYMARDSRLGRLVALKVIQLLESDSTSAERQQRVLTEARAVALLQHPHIVQIFEIGEDEGRLYLALEFVPGGSLAERLRREKLPPRIVAQGMAMLARAVQYAHEHGVLHRDLKPSNILLTEDGQPKIADFGLAKLQELPEERQAVTSEGVIVGTPSYMAPEQAAGERDRIGPAVDIYSLGTILYESLTGRPPFQGKTVMELLSQLATKEPISPQSLTDEVSVELSAICLKCLEKDPENRYASAQALAEDLERWLAGQPVSAARQTTLGRFVGSMQQKIWRKRK